jgi:hypothetical protein
MVIPFYNNNIHEAVSTDAYGNEKLRYIYIDREKDLMVACNTRILVTIPIEFDKQDKIPESVKHLYLSKEMFLYAKKNKYPIMFQEDGIHIWDVVYKYLEIGAYVPYEKFLIPDNSEEYIDVFQCRMNPKDLLAIVKANASLGDVVTIKFKVPKSQIKLNSDNQTLSAYGMVYDNNGKLGMIASNTTIYNLSFLKGNTGENDGQQE